jgi:hypothetical protein
LKISVNTSSDSPAKWSEKVMWVECESVRETNYKAEMQRELSA